MIRGGSNRGIPRWYTMAGLWLFQDANFGGPFRLFTPGLYSGQYELVGGYPRDNQEYPLFNNARSARVGPNTIAALYDPPAERAPSRVLVGPCAVADLADVYLAAAVSALRVVPFRPLETGAFTGCGATACAGQNMDGMRGRLLAGDWPAARLRSQEVGIGDRILSLAVDPGSIALVYESPDFDRRANAAVVSGPAVVRTPDDLGFQRIGSIRILLADPWDQAATDALYGPSAGPGSVWATGCGHPSVCPGGPLPPGPCGFGSAPGPPYGPLVAVPGPCGSLASLFSTPVVGSADCPSGVPWPPIAPFEPGPWPTPWPGPWPGPCAPAGCPPWASPWSAA